MRTELAVPTKDVLRAHRVDVASDNAFQRRARLLQALWREERGLPIGLHRGEPLGSRLAMPRAEELLESYLTETVRDVVRAEVLDPSRRADKLYGRPRIFNDLLSSQPLAFNLFGELQRDLDLATRLFQKRMPDRVARVTSIGFEHSPGRGLAEFTGDRSAFDVFVEHVTPDGGRGFVGIEVKYHESLRDKPAAHRERYDEVAAAMGVFRMARLAELRGSPLQQIWRDHLLAGSLVLAGIGYDVGTFVLLAPLQNDRCAKAVAAYRAVLQDASSFAAWTLEEVVADLRRVGASAWADGFAERYLAFQKVDDVVAS